MNAESGVDDLLRNGGPGYIGLPYFLAKRGASLSAGQ
jgi:hypothetical protein